MDGNEVAQDGVNISADKVELTTINEVTNKANIDLDTGARSRVDYIEKVKYIFEHNRMSIEVELEALKDFYINWYMGLQITRPGWNHEAYFNHDLEQTDLYVQDDLRLDSGTKAQSPSMERVTMRNDKGDVIHVMLDKDFGIGYTKIRDNDPVCYLRDNFQKFYYHLVKNNNVLIVPKGDTVRYRGAYIFGKNKAKNATNVTYFKEDGVKKAFVDFKVIATENIEYTSVEESFNCSFGSDTVTSDETNAYAKLII